MLVIKASSTFSHTATLRCSGPHSAPLLLTFPRYSNFLLCLLHWPLSRLQLTRIILFEEHCPRMLFCYVLPTHLMEKDCISASSTVVITGILPHSARVTRVLILIGVGGSWIQLDVSFHLGSGTAVVAWRITACCRVSAIHPWTDETSQRAVIHWRTVALLLSCLSHNLKASWHLT